MRLKELRESRQLTHLEIAKAINTSRTNIGRWEKGENEPSASSLAALADFFEVSTDYLLGREDDFGVIQTRSPGETLTQEERHLVEDYRALAPDLQEMIRATIATWKSSEANEERKKKKGGF